MPTYSITWTETKVLTSEITASSEEEALYNFESEGNDSLDWEPDTVRFNMSEVELQYIGEL